MDKLVALFKKYKGLIYAAIALIGFLLHLHSDYVKMQYTQTKHEEQIRELYDNQTKTWVIMAGMHQK